MLWAGVTVCRPVPKVGLRSSDLISFSSPGTEKGFNTVIPSKLSPKNAKIVLNSNLFSLLEMNSARRFSAKIKNSVPCFTSKY